MRRVLLLAALAVSAPGCLFQHITPEQQLTDQAHGYNDEVRWTRIDLAAQRVHPDYRGTFLASHAEWGSNVMVADAEVTGITFADDEATTLCRVAWYDQRTMEVTGTVVRQHWRMTENGFLLDRESIAAGDEGLLLLPEEDEEETAGDEVEATETGDEVLARR